MNVVYAITNNYVDKVRPSLASLKASNPKARVFVVTDAPKLDLDGVEVIDISDQEWFPKTGINYFNQFTYINLLKVCYPSLLKVNKVIHLDADTIINKPLDQLWKVDVTGKWFAAVQEKLGWYKPFGDVYYNMGVALINLAQMRKDKIEPVMVDYLNTVSQQWADQDAWNKYAIEQDKAVDLDLPYNECFATGYTDEPIIVHYCSISDWFTNRNIGRREYLDRWLNA